MDRCGGDIILLFRLRQKKNWKFTKKFHPTKFPPIPSMMRTMMMLKNCRQPSHLIRQQQEGTFTCNSFIKKKNLLIFSMLIIFFQFLRSDFLLLNFPSISNEGVGMVCRRRNASTECQVKMSNFCTSEFLNLLNISQTIKTRNEWRRRE